MNELPVTPIQHTLTDEAWYRWYAGQALNALIITEQNELLTVDELVRTALTFADSMMDAIKESTE